VTIFVVPKQAGRLQWIIEIYRLPDEDEGLQLLYGPFDSSEVAITFGQLEFGDDRLWRARSLWPVEEK
jgi:hypothetical protein